jgi:hypothetical protein
MQFCGALNYNAPQNLLILWRIRAWCATKFLISVAHVLVRHKILIFVAKILWSTTHAPQNAYFGAPQKRFSLLVYIRVFIMKE